MTRTLHHAVGFGAHWRSDIALPGFDPSPDDLLAGIVPIEVRSVDSLPDRADGRTVNSGVVYRDGVRWGWRDEVVFDMVDGTHIAYRPGAAWSGIMPASFYSTLAALTLAWRGNVPLHACAVELDGKAVLIAGPAGAGKSTLTAWLIAAEAGFIADDLSVVSIDAGGHPIVLRGRPTIRLHPATAALLDSITAEPVPDDPRGKWLVQPRCRCRADCLEIGAVLILDRGDSRSVHLVSPAKLLGHIFRRRWMSVLPMRADLIRKTWSVAASVPVFDYPAIGPGSGKIDPARQFWHVEKILSMLQPANRSPYP